MSKSKKKRCIVCKALFLPLPKNRRICSEKCREERTKLTYLTRIKPRNEIHLKRLEKKECLVCGKLFTPFQSTTKYCSKECQQNKKSSWLQIRFKIFERDNFTCQYCGRFSPEVILECDHIKPKSKGGRNTISNYITACRECNLGKGCLLLKERHLEKLKNR